MSGWFKSNRVDFDAEVAEKLVNLGVENLSDLADLDVEDIADLFPKKLQRKRFIASLEDFVMRELHEQEIREIHDQHEDGMGRSRTTSLESRDPDSEFSYQAADDRAGDFDFDGMRRANDDDVAGSRPAPLPPASVSPSAVVHAAGPLPPPRLPSHRRKMTTDIFPLDNRVVNMEKQLAMARAMRNEALYQEHAIGVDNQRKARRRFSIMNVLDPSAHTAAEEGKHTGTVLPPSTWSNLDEIVRIQQMRHDHLRPITGSPALVGAFDGAAAFLQHSHQGYANVAGQAPDKIRGRANLCNLPSDDEWGLDLTEDSRRPGVILVSHVFERSPAYDAGIERGDRLIALEGHHFKQHMDMGHVTSAIREFKRVRLQEAARADDNWHDEYGDPDDDPDDMDGGYVEGRARRLRTDPAPINLTFVREEAENETVRLLRGGVPAQDAGGLGDPHSRMRPHRRSLIAEHIRNGGTEQDFVDPDMHGVPEQHGVVRVVERYATSLRRVFVAYALDPRQQMTNNWLTFVGNHDRRHFAGWGEYRALVQSGCQMNKIKIAEFVKDFDIVPSLLSLRAVMRILRHVLKQDYRGGDGVGAPLQLLVGGDKRFMAVPTVHTLTPSQKQAMAQELDKNHGVCFPEFVELLCHIAEAAIAKPQYGELYPTTEDMIEGIMETWGVSDPRKLDAVKIIRTHRLTSAFRYS